MDFAFPGEVLQAGISFKIEVEYDAAFVRIKPLGGRIKNKPECLKFTSLNECSLEERFWAKVLQDEKGSNCEATNFEPFISFSAVASTFFLIALLTRGNTV